jgi:hypothetical protein
MAFWAVAAAWSRFLFLNLQLRQEIVEAAVLRDSSLFARSSEPGLVRLFLVEVVTDQQSQSFERNWGHIAMPASSSATPSGKRFCAKRSLPSSR